MSVLQVPVYPCNIHCGVASSFISDLKAILIVGGYKSFFIPAFNKECLIRFLYYFPALIVGSEEDVVALPVAETKIIYFNGIRYLSDLLVYSHFRLKIVFKHRIIQIAGGILNEVIMKGIIYSVYLNHIYLNIKGVEQLIQRV